MDETDCRYNQSIMTAWIGYTLGVPEYLADVQLDPDRDGRTEYTGYSDRWGYPADDCTEPSLDCVPVEYSSVLLNLYPDSNDVPREARYQHEICSECPKVDYDLAPAGEKWITWYYRHVDHYK
jgi:hypothetical protein